MVMRLPARVPWEELVEAVFAVVADQRVMTGCPSIAPATIRHRLSLPPHLLDASMVEIKSALQSLHQQDRVVPESPGWPFGARWRLPKEPA